MGNDEAVAWGALVANLLVLPGLGSLMVGRKVGWIQAALATGGVALMLVWLVTFVNQWLSLGEFPLDSGPEIRTGLFGIVGSGSAWLWSLVTSLEALRRARRR